jgi:hypothetical protein
MCRSLNSEKVGDYSRISKPINQLKTSAMVFCTVSAAILGSVA